jgi:hypothetical protein
MKRPSNKGGKGSVAQITPFDGAVMGAKDCVTLMHHLAARLL